MSWIVSDPDHLRGSPRVRDTRISVALLLEWPASGMSMTPTRLDPKDIGVAKKRKF